MRRHYLILIFCLISCTLADSWDDFTNNLATDLAPLITLFGEQVTKQFLSESLNILDNFIFALAPLGILTAVVSVIRVCGNSSLRAFIGRAHEGPGEAEHELLSCVSETTAELFNDGGISRVFGRPKILEVVTWEDDFPNDPDKPRIASLRGAIDKGIWRGTSFDGSPEDPTEFDIPNLSLNKGIKSRSQLWFHSAAIVGSVFQIGIIVFAAITVFIFPLSFKKDGKAVAAYAFPLFVIGTTLLCAGMFLCAFIIERSSIEYYFHPTKRSKIYWLQPGGQEVGDQVFGAFLGVREGTDGCATKDLEYIKSLRDHNYHDRDSWLLAAVSVTMIGFICQFVGLRGLHSSITLAQLGSTLLMAVIRTSLRMERTDLDDNLLSSKERRLTSHNKQELDCFAFHLENVESLFVCAKSTSLERPTQGSPPDTAEEGRLGQQVVKTRTHLAALTGDNNKSQNFAWDDLPVRKVARDLKRAIETTMEVIALWSNKRLGSYKFDITLECQAADETTAPVREQYSIQLQRMEDTLHWKIDDKELEAILGLWTWSLLKSDQNLVSGEPLYRVIGQDHQEALAESTDLLYHKWIFRQTEARMVSAKMIPASRGMFGGHLNHLPNDMEILVMRTDNSLYMMAAQDLYIYFLNSAFTLLEGLGGEIGVLPGSRDGFVAHSSRIEELARCFETNHLGSREDALVCIVPALQQKRLLPELSADLNPIRQCVERYIEKGEWTEALSMVRWICERSEGEEFERSVIELGYLYRRAMLHSDPNVREEGLNGVCAALQYDLRSEYFRHLSNPRPPEWIWSQELSIWWGAFTRQLGWIAWHIAVSFSATSAARRLETCGMSDDLFAAGVVDGSEDTAKRGKLALLGWLTKNDDKWFDYVVFGEDDCLALDWVCQNDYNILLQWLAIIWEKVGFKHPRFLYSVLVSAAKRKYRSAICALRRRGANVNVIENEEGKTPLIQLVIEGDLMAVEELLGNGADVNAKAGHGGVPLIIAAHQGMLKMVELLLKWGAAIEMEDDQGLTALMMATDGNHRDVVRALLIQGADINKARFDGFTALIIAAFEDLPELLELLLSEGAEVDAQTNDGSTPLMLAARNNCVNNVRLLLQHNADVHKKSLEGDTALERATYGQHQEIIQLLEAASER